MPGKGDYGADPIAPEGYIPAQYGKGQYAPGSKEYRAWDEGWHANLIDGATKGDCPYTAQSRPFEFDAWMAGWEEANAGRGERKQPAVRS